MLMFHYKIYTVNNTPSYLNDSLTRLHFSAIFDICCRKNWILSDSNPGRFDNQPAQLRMTSYS